MSAAVDDPIAKIEQLLQGSDGRSRSYQKKLAQGIVSMLYYKYMFYRKRFEAVAEEIVTRHQPRVMKKLCSMGVGKPVVEYLEVDARGVKHFYSMVIPQMTRIDALTGERKAYTRQDYTRLVAAMPRSSRSLFELTTQCLETPGSAVVTSIQELSNAGEAIPEEEYLGVDDKLPDRTFVYDEYALRVFAQDAGIPVPKSRGRPAARKAVTDYLTENKQYDARQIKKVLGIWNELATGKWTDAQARQEARAEPPVEIVYPSSKSQTTGGEEEKPTVPPKAEFKREETTGLITPGYEDIKADIEFYTSVLDERNEVKVMIDTIRPQLENLGDIQWDQLDPTKDDLDLAKVTLNDAAIRWRLANPPLREGEVDSDTGLAPLLENFRVKVGGATRASIRADVAALVNGFVANWRLYSSSYLNLCLIGSPGVGKTEAAVSFGLIMAKIGILAVGGFKLQSRATMVGQYVGQTALKVRNVLVGGLENVVFIDEAYALTQSSAEALDPYGVEAINEIVGFLDKYRGKICLIAAGYECEMQKYWFNVNPGLRRRTRYTWTLGAFSPGELYEIVKSNVNSWKAEYRCITREAFGRSNDCAADRMILESPQVGQYLYEIVKTSAPIFTGNAGDAASLADVLVSEYYAKTVNSPNAKLTRDDVRAIMKSFLRDRTQVEERSVASGCNPTVDQASTGRWVKYLGSL